MAPGSNHKSRAGEENVGHFFYWYIKINILPCMLREGERGSWRAREKVQQEGSTATRIELDPSLSLLRVHRVREFENATERKAKPTLGRHGKARRGRATQVRRGKALTATRASRQHKQPKRTMLMKKKREGEQARNLKGNKNSAARQQACRTHRARAAAMGMHGCDALGQHSTPSKSGMCSRMISIDAQQQCMQHRASTNTKHKRYAQYVENRGTVPRYAAHTSRAAQTPHATAHLPEYSNEAVPALTCTWHRGWAAL